jgi:hypothetical protein
VLPAFGEMRVCEVTVARVDAFLRGCESQLKHNTVRSVLTAVSGVLACVSIIAALNGGSPDLRLRCRAGSRTP